MGKPSRDKGAREERALVKRMIELGLEARKVPLSGACVGFKDDVQYRTGEGFGIWHSCEAKVRANALKQLYQWLPEKGVLALRRCNKKEGKAYDWLIVQRIEDWVGGLL